jgi:hypothetical protein
MRVGAWAVGLVLAASWAGEGYGHGLAPARLELEEVAQGRFRVALKIPGEGEAAREAPLEPRWPAHCVPSRPEVLPGADHVALTFTLDCGAQGLAGHRVALDGLADRQIDALVRVTRLGDGAVSEVEELVLRPTAPGFVLPPTLGVAEAVQVGLRAALGAPALGVWLLLALLLGARLAGRPARAAAPWLAAGAAAAALLPGRPGLGLAAVALVVAAGLRRGPAGPWLAVLALLVLSVSPGAADLPQEHLRVGQAAAGAGLAALMGAAVAVGWRWPRLGGAGRLAAPGSLGHPARPPHPPLDVPQGV